MSLQLAVQFEVLSSLQSEPALMVGSVVLFSSCSTNYFLMAGHRGFRSISHMRKAEWSKSNAKCAPNFAIAEGS